MKMKTWLIILGVVTILLFYNLFAYNFANKLIDRDTRYVISSYLDVNWDIKEKYQYIKALNNDDGTISVYIKIDNDYYQVRLERNGGYKVLLINKDIPVYIR